MKEDVAITAIQLVTTLYHEEMALHGISRDTRESIANHVVDRIEKMINDEG